MGNLDLNVHQIKWGNGIYRARGITANFDTLMSAPRVLNECGRNDRSV